jgi:perosamine synthetase
MSAGVNNYPKPAVPLSPVLSWYSTHISKPGNYTSNILDCKFKLQLTSGRAAILMALEDTGVNSGDEVLLPSFHCESMVAPVRWLGATPVFYRINSDSSIDVDDIESKISANTKAIIVTHYFGFLQNLSPVVELCRGKNIKTIEDCAHAFFGSRDGKTVGSQGDYAIASSMKFFPVLDGGVLASNTIDISSIELKSSPWAFELKSLINSIEISIRYRRLGIPGRLISVLMGVKDYLWSGIKNLRGRDIVTVSTPSSSQGGQELDEEWLKKRASLASRQIVAYSDTRRIVDLRRANYLRLDDAFRNLPGCHPLHTSLPSNCVPLVYPLYVENAKTLFPILKRKAIPIWRFGEFLDRGVTTGVCQNSVNLSAHVFQFPCHQELQDSEIRWIIDSVVKVITESDQGTI